jgi:hypothetical protein
MTVTDADIERDKRDAARYRWLREVFFEGRSAFALVGPTRTPMELDTAIDAAMREKVDD